MILNFKNNIWQSTSRILLFVIIILIVALINFDFYNSFQNFDFLVQKNYSNNNNFYLLLILVTFLTSILITNSLFEKKYIFKLSNLLIALLFFLFLLPMFIFLSFQFSLNSNLDFLLKKKIEKVERKSFIDEDDLRTYQYIIEKDTLYYGNYSLYGNKDKSEHNNLLNGEIYKTLLRKNYFIKFNSK